MGHHMMEPDVHIHKNVHKMYTSSDITCQKSFGLTGEIRETRHASPPGDENPEKSPDLLRIHIY